MKHAVPGIEQKPWPVENMHSEFLLLIPSALSWQKYIFAQSICCERKLSSLPTKGRALASYFIIVIPFYRREGGGLGSRGEWSSKWRLRTQVSRSLLAPSRTQYQMCVCQWRQTNGSQCLSWMHSRSRPPGRNRGSAEEAVISKQKREPSSPAPRHAASMLLPYGFVHFFIPSHQK